MKVFAPEYYKRFKCIADKCRHSCCIAWEIDIDERTLEKYEKPAEYCVKSSIEYDEQPHFRLESDERCPHLDERGLCRIITHLGEDYLCDICREHPRFYNLTKRGMEAGIGMACEEASRIILSSDDYNSFCCIFETEDMELSSEFDGIWKREEILNILSDRERSYDERIALIRKSHGLDEAFSGDDRWRELIYSLEYLDESHKELFSLYSSSLQTEKELWEPLERALAYFVYRHCSSSEDEGDFYASLGFSLFCERLMASIGKNNDKINIFEIGRIVSEELEYSQDNTDNIKSEFLF